MKTKYILSLIFLSFLQNILSADNKITLKFEIIQGCPQLSSIKVECEVTDTFQDVLNKINSEYNINAGKIHVYNNEGHAFAFDLKHQINRYLRWFENDNNFLEIIPEIKTLTASTELSTLQVSIYYCQFIYLLRNKLIQKLNEAGFNLSSSQDIELRHDDKLLSNDREMVRDIPGLWENPNLSIRIVPKKW